MMEGNYTQPRPLWSCAGALCLFKGATCLRPPVGPCPPLLRLAQPDPLFLAVLFLTIALLPFDTLPHCSHPRLAAQYTLVQLQPVHVSGRSTPGHYQTGNMIRGMGEADGPHCSSAKFQLAVPCRCGGQHPSWLGLARLGSGPSMCHSRRDKAHGALHERQRRAASHRCASGSRLVSVPPSGRHSLRSALRRVKGSAMQRADECPQLGYGRNPSAPPLLPPLLLPPP